jgi:hypothetical protein
MLRDVTLVRAKGRAFSQELGRESAARGPTAFRQIWKQVLNSKTIGEYQDFRLGKRMVESAAGGHNPTQTPQTCAVVGVGTR